MPKALSMSRSRYESRHFGRRAWHLGPVRGAIAGALLLLGGCGGGGDDGAAPPTEPPPVRAQALALAQPGELVAYAQRKLRERQTARDATPGQPLELGGAPTTAAVSDGAAPASLPSFSSTLTQETDVDEADLLKTDGQQIHALDLRDMAAPRLRLYQRSADGSLSALSSTSVTNPSGVAADVRGLVVVDGAAAVVSQAWLPLSDPLTCAGGCPAKGDAAPGAATPFPGYMARRVFVQRFDTRQPNDVRAGTRISIEGHLLDTRRIGNHLVVVTVHRPLLGPEMLPTTATAAQRDAAIANVVARDLLPKVQVNSSPAQPLLADNECWLQTDNASRALELTTVTVFDLRTADLARQSRCFAGGSEALYMSPTHLYLASTALPYTVQADGIVRYAEQALTQVHKFSLSNGSVAYRGSGTVDGHLGWNADRKSLRFSEHNGDLRVLTFTGALGWAFPTDSTRMPASPATLTVLRESATGGRLDRLAVLPNTQRPQPLGKPGEQVYGVRFVGDRGYVVTFRQIDPLYVLDLSNPADPRAAGEIELPGFSDHLLPLPNGLLVGVGKDADASGRLGGIKLALFDVANATTPKVLSTQALGQVGSTTGLDVSRHGLNMMVKDNQARLSVPLTVTAQPWAQAQAGLQRIEVDLTTRSMRLKPLLDPSNDPVLMDLWRQRSVQVGDQLYWLRDGQVLKRDW